MTVHMIMFVYVRRLYGLGVEERELIGGPLISVAVNGEWSGVRELRLELVSVDGDNSLWNGSNLVESNRVESENVISLSLSLSLSLSPTSLLFSFSFLFFSFCFCPTSSPRASFAEWTHRQQTEEDDQQQHNKQYTEREGTGVTGGSSGIRRKDKARKQDEKIGVVECCTVTVCDSDLLVQLLRCVR